MEHVARLREQLQCGGIDGAINWLRHTTEIVPDYSDMVDFMPDALTTWLWAVQHATMLGPLSIGDISHRVYEFYDALEPMMDCWCSRVGPTIDLLIDYCVVLECSQFTVMLEYAGALLLRVACNSADPNFVEAFESVYAAFFGTASDRLTKFEFFMPSLTSAVRSTGIMAVQSNAVFVRHNTHMHAHQSFAILTRSKVCSLAGNRIIGDADASGHPQAGRQCCQHTKARTIVCHCIGVESLVRCKCPRYFAIQYLSTAVGTLPTFRLALPSLCPRSALALGRPHRSPRNVSLATALCVVCRVPLPRLRSAFFF